MQMEQERVEPQGTQRTLWPGGLTLRLQVAEQRLGVVQGAGGKAAHTVLGQAAGRAQQRVPCLLYTSDAADDPRGV